MIKANELRVGNLVLISGKTKIIKAVNADGTISFEDKGSIDGVTKIYNTKSVYGVVINPEILQKCGFEKETICSYFIEPNTGIMLSNDFELCTTDGYGEVISIGNPLKYLHKLQNVILDLTGEELEIKEFYD